MIRGIFDAMASKEVTDEYLELERLCVFQKKQ